MIINCEVWKQDGSEIRCGGFVYSRMFKVRTMIDTDLYNWWYEGVTFIKQDYGYPYPNQCMVHFKEKGKYPLIIDKDTLFKIREKLGKTIVNI